MDLIKFAKSYKNLEEADEIIYRNYLRLDETKKFRIYHNKNRFNEKNKQEYQLTLEKRDEQINEINKTFDMPFLGSDIIAGFAGESEEDFQITKENLEKSGLTQIHTFPYSIREGTVGANSTEQVDEKTKEQRANIIKAISHRKHEEFISNNIGKIREVLIEKRPDKKTGFLKGVTRNYLTVIINSKDEKLFNTLANVKITKYEQGKIYGELV